MHALDAFILRHADRVATALQRRGWLLTNTYVWLAAATLLFSISSVWVPTPEPAAVGLMVIVWGIWLFVSVRWAERNRDYPQSVKLMQQLNAAALLERERTHSRFIRLVWLSFFIISIAVLAFVGVSPKRVFITLTDISAATMLYLQACTFLGPGDFASKRNREFAQDSVPYET